MDNNMIYYSRCSVGKGKWFWVAKLEEDYLEGKDPFAYGYASTADEAEAMAVAASLKRHPDRTCKQVQGYTAEFFKRCLVAREKVKKRSVSTATAQVEYLYRDFWDCDGSWPHHIVKRTKKKVFVDREPSHRRTERFQYGDWRDFAEQRTFVLDREKLEKEGRAWSRTARDAFYTTPYEEREHRYVPECGKVLGLIAPWTTEQVKQVFRSLVKKAHPDSGGDDEEFKKLHKAYEEALTMAMDRVAG